MLKPLLNQLPADGNGPAKASQPASQPAPPADRETATPPVAAETVADGKSEREALLERENAKLKAAIKRTADSKRKVEMANIKLASENQDLKQIPQPAGEQPAKPKRSWGFFTE